MVFNWHFKQTNNELTDEQILDRYLHIQSVNIKCNLQRLQKLFRNECMNLDNHLFVQVISMLNNNAINIDKLQVQIRNNEKNILILKTVNYWFKHAIGIIVNADKNIDLILFYDEYSKIIINIINALFVSQSFKKQLIEEKYKPSRIQYIIDNFGIDALDNY